MTRKSALSQSAGRVDRSRSHKKQTSPLLRAIRWRNGCDCPAWVCFDRSRAISWTYYPLSLYCTNKLFLTVIPYNDCNIYTFTQTQSTSSFFLELPARLHFRHCTAAESLIFQFCSSFMENEFKAEPGMELKATNWKPRAIPAWLNWR